MHTVIMQCGSLKVDTRKDENPDTVAARDLYTSGYATVKRNYHDTFGDRLVILSAEHGFIHGDAQLEFYDTTAGDEDFSYEEWAGQLQAQAAGDETFATPETVAALHGADKITLLAGGDYAEYAGEALDAAELVDAEIYRPFETEPEAQGGMGYQMEWMNDQIAAAEGE